MRTTKRYITAIRRPYGARRFKRTEGTCDACGDKATFQYFNVIGDNLAQEWDISDSLKKRYSVRESMHCSSCRCSARLRAQAKAISLTFDPKKQPLKHGIDNGVFNDMQIAEINACGDLHKILASIEGLEYSEYAPKDKNIQHQDLQNLTHESNAFDLVLTSDTLEHIPDYKKALKEIHRILKKGGYHIFTVPLIFSRSTRRRVGINKGKITEILPASYHGAGEPDNLVSSEFGIDFLHDLKQAGFNTEIFFANPINRNEVNFVFVTKKV